jgi:hypothetical protein
MVIILLFSGNGTTACTGNVEVAAAGTLQLSAGTVRAHCHRRRRPSPHRRFYRISVQ